MLLPHGKHLIERNPFRLRQEKRDEGGHEGDPAGVEQERGELEVAEHGEEGLGQDEGGGEVDGDADTLAGGPDLHREDFTWNEPT